MNTATFAGRLGRDAETRHVQGGHIATSWSLAVDERRGGEKITLWIDCTLWGERGEKLAEYLLKGTPVAVSGQVGVRTYEAQGETKAVITLNVREVTLLGSKQEGQGDGGQRQQSQQQRPAAERPAQRPAPTPSRRSAPAPASRSTDPYPDDDIPF